MKKYTLKVMHPGGTTYDETIKAEGYYIESHCAYAFYVNSKTICSYPVMFTIIEKIENA
jgi:hypothetical protein